LGYGVGFPPEYGLRKMGCFACNAMATMEFQDRQETILRSQVNEFHKKQRRAKEIQTREVTPAAIKAFRASFDPKTWSQLEVTHPEQAEMFFGLKSDKDIGDAILRGDLPTEEEIDDANERLTAHAKDLVTQANAFYAAGNQLEATQPPYLWAAKRTGNSGLPWAKGVVMMVNCAWCQSPINPEAILCLACGNIAPGKEQAVIDARLPKFEHLWKHLEEGKGGKQQPRA
jgi:hypothetical protein